MRLEFEPAVTAPPLRPVLFNENDVLTSDDFQKLLQKGIAAAKNGERDEARDFLMQATEIDSFSEDAWMWLASISDYPEELVAFLNNVLTINPSNDRAIKWLAETETLLAKSNEANVVTLEPLYSPPALEVASQPRPVNCSACPFCAEDNDAGAIQCRSCRAVISLSDIEELLSNPHADRARIYESVTEMESEWDLNELNEKELTSLGIGHLNLRNFEEGLKYLHELLSRDTNNVILSGQLNSMAIRIDEIHRQDEIDETKPKGKTILVVDDSATVRKLLTSKLEKSGHNVVCAVDGVDGLAKIAEILPDMVFLDISMPRMDGYEVCKEIRANPVAKNLPVVMISGKDGFFDKVRGKMAGASGYVTKPFGPDALMKALETHLAAEQPAAEH